MSSVLVPCSGCARHLRAAERSCPFCGQPQAHASRAERAGRGAFIALGASLVMTTTGASAQPAGDDGDTYFSIERAALAPGSTPRPMMVQYGAPPPPPEDPEPEPEPEPPEAKPPPARRPTSSGGSSRGNPDA